MELGKEGHKEILEPMYHYSKITVAAFVQVL